MKKYPGIKKSHFIVEKEKSFHVFYHTYDDKITTSCYLRILFPYDIWKIDKERFKLFKKFSTIVPEKDGISVIISSATQVNKEDYNATLGEKIAYSKAQRTAMKIAYQIAKAMIYITSKKLDKYSNLALYFNDSIFRESKYLNTFK